MQLSLRALLAGLATALACAGCAPLQPKGDPTQAAVGSTFVRSQKNSGSYGSADSILTFTRMAPTTWQGKEVGVWSQTGGPTLLMTPGGAFVAFLNADTPMLSFDPPASYEFPLAVGKSWTGKWNMTVHATKQTIPVESKATVEAYEDVTVPAGTFKAFRIRSVDNVGNDDVNWFSTEMGIWVKQKLTRTAKHANGAGARETELLSQTIKK